MTRAKDISKILTDADISGNIDVDGVTNLDVVDIDGAVDMASTLQVDGAITSSSGMTITTADNNPQLTIISTDADASRGAMLDLVRNSASPSDNDLCGTIRGLAKNSAGEDVTLGEIIFRNEDVTDGTEDGQIILNMMRNGASAQVMKLSSTETVLNGDSVDLDFRVESNGNANMLFVDGGNDKVGIGTASPTADGLHIFHATQPDFFMGNNTDADGFVIIHNDTDTMIGNRQQSHLRFKTDDTERIRIFSTGNTTFNTTNQSPAEGTAVGARIGTTGKVQLSAASAACLQANRSDNNGGVIVFRRGGTVCGEIAVNGDSQTTAYQTSSDYRLKENVSYDFDATARLKQLKPARFNWISDKNNITVDGFLAHEVSSIVPEAIGGEKDGTQELDDVVLNSDGTVNSSEITEKDWIAGKEDKTYADDTTWIASKTVPKYQGIDQAKLVPLLVKTIQELEARITALESA